MGLLKNYTKSKYSNVKTITKNITFDSKRESVRYNKLLLLQRAHEITELRLQPSFVLQQKFTDCKGATQREIKYVADFMYIDKLGNIHIEDCKGMKTDIYKLKRKLFLFKFPTLYIDEI